MSDGYRKLRVFSFKADPEIIRRFEEIAREKGYNKSELLRLIIARYIREYEDSKRPFISHRIKIK